MNTNLTYINKLERSTGNSTADVTFNQHYHVARLITTYFLPFICIMGLVCNTLAIITFLQHRLRKYSCSIYLIVRSISDSIFLLNISIIYLSSIFNYEINRMKGICHVLVFMTYVSAFVSVWVVTMVTIENFIRICYPFEAKRMCSTKTAKISICVLVTLAICVYHVSIWISNESCAPSADFVGVTQAFVYIDTVLTLILPSILLTFLIIAIIINILQTHKKRKSFTAKSHLRSVHKLKRHNASPITTVTKMLLAVSLTFFLLNVPSHTIRIKFLISAFVRGTMIISSTEAAIQELAQLLYYSSMAINFFIYLSFGKNFRRVFKKTFLKDQSEDLSDTADKEIRHVTPFADRNVSCEDTCLIEIVNTTQHLLDTAIHCTKV